jgi:ATP-binding cassette subfamily B multidrug efflux pump
MLRALRRLLPYVLDVRAAFIIGFSCILAATAASLAAPWVLKYVVDGLIDGVSRTLLGLYALATLALAVADGAFRYGMRKQLVGASRQIEYRLRNDFFAHLERLPLAYFQAHRTGDLMSRATNDLSAVRMMVGPAVMYLASTALGFVIAVIVMGSIDLRLTLIALAPLPGVTLATHFFGRAIHDRFERIQDQLADLSAVVQESLVGVRVIRAYRQERHEIARFQRANDEYVRRNRGLIRLQGAFYPSLTLCFGLSGLLVLWVGGRDVMQGRLTLGEFVAFSRYLVLLSWPLIAFGWVINIVQRGVASWERMLEVLDAPAHRERHEAHEGRRDLRGTPARGAVLEVRGLTFRYPGASAPAIQDVSFSVAMDRTVALIGPTGSGKSTIVELVARLHEPPRGTVFLDGVDVLDVPRTDLRRALAVVPQEPFLFSDAIGANIGFGIEDEWSEPRVRDRIEGAARDAGLAGDIADLPRGLETRIGERGITLSGGQKQRAAIARALATDPRVLILDDALSSVDTATEDAILKNLRRTRAARATLVVAHRVSTIRDADEILVIEAGRVVERGTHDALVAAGGAYATLFRRQQLEEEIARV